MTQWAGVDGEVLGALFFEVLTPEPGADAPTLPGWQVRLWPQARLGDATVEAIPEADGARATALLTGLRAAGFTPLGRPVLHPH
ncbi:hypothetical protein [Deinococcus maricopensis]|uniref:Uncharacterized protein n=1 Tax=Deinococcus maricopensis (strain DSM 21211 / LMG 22137 / NRRL B-23946 / LB-34) TaxID=709986 RepID=E8UAH1_DEIML|nr:hypothetical protein [Deinococcus maricopensis]ADV68060.1 hypothetical protein Deima_2422 [Deinococcus maricopensis DSM 21211]